MHSSPFFLSDVAGFLGGYYAFIAGMNGVFAYLLWQKYGQTGRALVWTVFAGAMMILASLALSGAAAWVPALPAGVRSLVNALSGPVIYSLGTVALFTVLFVFRKFFVQPTVAWAILNGSLVLMGLAMADENFAAIVMKPDNVPIVGLVFLLAQGLEQHLATQACCQHHDAHDALGIDAATIAGNPNFAGKLAGRLRQLGGGTCVQSELVDDFNF